MKYIFFIISMCSYIADSASADYGRTKSTKEQIRDILFVDLGQFKHKDLVAFGLTCKDNDGYLCRFFDLRKAYIFKICSSDIKVNIDFLQWHRYGSRAEYKKIVDDSESRTTKKKLMLARLELADKGTVKECFGAWSDFESELWYKPIPFYNMDKRLCFFGNGWIDVVGYGLCGNVVCYIAAKTIHGSDSIQRQYHPSAIRCVLCFKKQNGEDGKDALCRLSEFTHVLKAILDSGKYTQEKMVREAGTVAWLENDCLLFDLEKINIPDDYKQCVQNPKYQDFCSTFDQLPKELAYAITKRYQDQKNDQTVHSPSILSSDS